MDASDQQIVFIQDEGVFASSPESFPADSIPEEVSSQAAAPVLVDPFAAEDLP
jgi:hypothetical protein